MTLTAVKTKIKTKHLCKSEEKLFICERCKKRTNRIESNFCFPEEVLWICPSCRENYNSSINSEDYWR